MGPEDFQEEAPDDDDDATEAFDSIAEDLKKESQLTLKTSLRQDSSMLRSGNAAWLLWRIVDGIASRRKERKLSFRLQVDEMEPILSAFRIRLTWRLS